MSPESPEDHLCPNILDENTEKAKLRHMLESRFKHYCRSDRLTREAHHKLADALVEDLMANEWDVLNEHLDYSKAQSFYRSREMWEMLQRARERVGDIFQIYPIPDAIVHALLDAH